MSAPLLEAALASVGIAATVEAQGKIAVLSPASTLPLDAASRRRIVALARDHGFANVALELAPRADLPGD